MEADPDKPAAAASGAASARGQTPDTDRPAARQRIEAELRELLGQTYALPPEQLAALETGAALFGGGLGLDSLDSMPLVLAIEDHFGVVLRNDAATRRAFASVWSLAQHLAGLTAEREGRSLA